MPPKKPFAGPVLRQGGSSSHIFTPAPDAHHQGTMGCNVRYRVEDLLKGGREAVLVHCGQDYRLRITSTGKLILTK
ncbi:MAG TPA: hemin uptake protein HemP [Hyphomicrobium sp.]|nr:hemin uptake protein HemP [Hyphomicrobium sp.]